MKNCPQCGAINNNYAVKCNKCSHEFPDSMYCPNCGKENRVAWKECLFCKAKLNNDSGQENKNDEAKKVINTNIEFTCITCKEVKRILITEEFSAFGCPKCRAIYSIVLSSNEVMVSMVRKGKVEEKLPKNITEALKYFGVEGNSIEIQKIKSIYKEMISKYHPDKVQHLGSELKELAEKKTKEIVEKYEELVKYTDEK